MHIIFTDRKLSSGEFLPYKWKILNSGELLPYKWRILNSEGAFCSLIFLYKYFGLEEMRRKEFLKEMRMEEFKLYSVSDEYVECLRKDFPNVYSNKVNARTHTRKYLGVVFRIGKYNYYIPMSSPKDSDYQIAGTNKVIKKSIVPTIRIVVKNIHGEKELKGTLRISHMIPVPTSQLTLYDLENEPDNTYKDLVQNEMIFIRKNREKIAANAKLLYKQKVSNDSTAGYVKAALDYQALEVLCDSFENYNAKSSSDNSLKTEK